MVPADAEEREMGQITVPITVRNAYDARRAEEGGLAASSVRTARIEDALVDTGATTLCLPAAVIQDLGLIPSDEVQVATATGYTTSRLYEGAEVTCEGRRRVVQALALPGSTRVLLGAFPLEILGLEPDLANRRLRVLPDHGPQTYLTIL
jgi:predicted aspartyl protease